MEAPPHTSGSDRHHVRTILLHREAPAKPIVGAPCNGCGLCCAVEPCPLGVLISGRRRGRCRALRFDLPQRRYVCGVAAEPRRWLRFLPGEWARRLALRWISAGSGCDASIEPG